MCFHRQIVSALHVAHGNRRLGLLDELLDLSHHLLLAGIKLATPDLFQITLDRSEQLIRGIALLRSLCPPGAAH